MPTLEELCTLIRLLPRHATGQTISNYMSVTTGPKREGDTDGPEHFHIILLDGGRSQVPGGDMQDKRREWQFERGLKSKVEAWGIAAWCWTAQRPAIYAMLTKVTARALSVMGSSDRLIHKLPFSDGWITGATCRPPRVKPLENCTGTGGVWHDE